MNSSITMVNWWSHSPVNNFLINFETSVLLLKWGILEYICSYWCSILYTTMMIVLVFSQIFYKELINCTQAFTTKQCNRNTTSIIWFPEILSFLLVDSSSISSSLDEDNEGVWETENVLLLVANVSVTVGTTASIMYRYSNCHFLIHYLQLRIELIPVFTLFKSCLLTPKKPILYFISLCSLFNSCKSFPQGTVYSYLVIDVANQNCFSKSILSGLSRFLRDLVMQGFTGFSTITKKDKK